MTIELITGTPGAGKSTYAVSQRLAKEQGRPIPLDAETCLKLGLDLGTVIERRIVQAGIRGLLVPHERLPHILTRDATPPTVIAEWNSMQQEQDEKTGKMVDSDYPKHMRLPGDPPVECDAIAQNWWLWCKPGDLICIDEAQFLMPRGSLGQKPPYWIQAMEIHRHYGVDFIFITQHPQLIATVVRALVALHRHVRSVMGFSLCTVYTWDHAANPERFNLATKSVWKRGKSDYRLFHSSVAHVAPPSSGRSIMIVIPVLMLAGAGLVWHYKARHAQAPALMSSAAAATLPTSAPAVGQQMTQASYRPPGFADVPHLQGCYSIGDRCTCIGSDTRPVRVEHSMCMTSAGSFDGLVQWETSRSLAPASTPGTPASAPPQALPPST